MRPIDHTETSPGYGRGSLRPHSNYTPVTTGPAFRTDVRSTPHLAGVDDNGNAALAGLATGLAPGQRGALPFELAAVICGHDPCTATGAADARHDHRVWDLVNNDTQGARQ